MALKPHSRNTKYALGKSFFANYNIDRESPCQIQSEKRKTRVETEPQRTYLAEVSLPRSGWLESHNESLNRIKVA